MHDFHLADTIHKTIMDYALKNNLKKISKVVLELGSIIEHGQDILPENLKFNLLLLSEGGLSAGMAVIIEPIKGDSWILREIEGE